MTICIIEDEIKRHRTLHWALSAIYKTATIIPDEERPCNTWQKAQALVQKTPKDDEVIIFLDLILEDEDQNDIEKAIYFLPAMQRISCRRQGPRG